MSEKRIAATDFWPTTVLTSLLIMLTVVLLMLLQNNNRVLAGDHSSLSSYYQILNSSPEHLLNKTRNETTEGEDQWDAGIVNVRFKVTNFPKSMSILGREVTCNTTELDEIYAEPTWACENISVDGNRLPYAYIGDAKRNDEDLLDKDYYQCGFYNPFHDGQALCRHLLGSLGFSTDVHFVLITSASCQTIDNGIMFNRNYSYHHGYSWTLRNPSYGYTKSLRCGALR